MDFINKFMIIIMSVGEWKVNDVILIFWGFPIISILLFLSHKRNQISLIGKKKPSNKKIPIFHCCRLQGTISWSIRKELLNLEVLTNNLLWAFWSQHSETSSIVSSFLISPLLLLRASAEVFLVPKSMSSNMLFNDYSKSSM